MGKESEKFPGADLPNQPGQVVLEQKTTEFCRWFRFEAKLQAVFSSKLRETFFVMVKITLQERLLKLAVAEDVRFGITSTGAGACFQVHS